MLRIAVFAHVWTSCECQTLNWHPLDVSLISGSVHWFVKTCLWSHVTDMADLLVCVFFFSLLLCCITRGCVHRSLHKNTTKPEPYVCSLVGPLDLLWCCFVFGDKISVVTSFGCGWGVLFSVHFESYPSCSFWTLFTVQMLFGMFRPKYNTDLHHRTVNSAPLFIRGAMTSLTRPDQSQTFFFPGMKLFLALLFLLKCEQLCFCGV